MSKNNVYCLMLVERKLDYHSQLFWEAVGERTDIIDNEYLQSAHGQTLQGKWRLQFENKSKVCLLRADNVSSFF